MVLIAVGIKLSSKGPVIFSQKRAGKNGRTFTLYKFRTMYVGAHKDKHKFLGDNEADGPVFKIRDDPRFVGIGKFLARTGLDELPQLFNVVKGDMALVGPRPLPIDEQERMPLWQRQRENALPGITSPWVINGHHSVSFKDWMKSDLDYIQKQNILTDLLVLGKTLVMMVKLLLNF